MSEPSRKWDDLGTRLATAGGLILFGGGALALGGVVLLAVVSVACALMVWELVRMLAPQQPIAARVLAVLAGIVIFTPFLNAPTVVAATLLIAVGAAWLRSGRLVFSLYTVVIVAGCFSIFFTRSFFLQHVLWLGAIVVVTDVAGYLVGRSVGGPKFWPRVSPKKTWSGTIGGWVGAAIVGLLFAPTLGSWVIIASVLLSFASQMGDIMESAIKRRAGIKDSSSLLPGHGGLLDRFDGMIATFAVWLVLVPVVANMPGSV